MFGMIIIQFFYNKIDDLEYISIEVYRKEHSRYEKYIIEEKHEVEKIYEIAKEIKIRKVVYYPEHGVLEKDYPVMLTFYFKNDKKELMFLDYGDRVYKFLKIFRGGHDTGYIDGANKELRQTIDKIVE